MSLRRMFAHRSPNPHLATKLHVGSVLILTLAAIASCLLLMPVRSAHASGGSLTLGTMTVNPNPVVCPSTDGWYYYTNGGNNYYLNCYVSTVTNCTNAADWQLTFGWLNPVGIVPGITQAKGLIILHSGRRGDQAGKLRLCWPILYRRLRNRGGRLGRRLGEDGC